MCGWVQVDSRCDHVSISWFGKVCNWGWDMLVARRCSFGGFPWIGRVNFFKVRVIFVSSIHEAFHK